MNNSETDISDLTFQQVAKILGVEQAFRIAGLAAFLERIYGCLARVNALLGDIAQELLVERRRMGIQGGVGRVVETEHLAVVRQAAQSDPLPLDMCEEL